METPPPHESPDTHDAFAAVHELLNEEGERDLLDEPVLPLLGLSAGTLAAVFLGGALGTMARYLLEAHHQTGSGAFPWVTLLVNLTGSLAIGFLVPLTEHVAPRAPLVRPLALIGFLGGWTTYSTLAVDATLLGKNGDFATCLAYLVATVAGGLALVVAGHAAARRLMPA
ncbi:MAG TPA: CrcB family protein [Acidimicrobiales bacterium]|nr:CrcB family protein [Acidimicrobiales bacterium]